MKLKSIEQQLSIDDYEELRKRHEVTTGMSLLFLLKLGKFVYATFFMVITAVLLGGALIVAAFGILGTLFGT